MNYFATEYTIHFDDTMAYGSHHFLTAFKLQCAARESFLFGERIFDISGVEQALDRIQLLTADAYARNLHAAKLGERLAILLTIEEWHRASARFCYRVLRADGQPICAGFQTLIGVDADSGLPIPLPDPLWQAMEEMRAIEEPTIGKIISRTYPRRWSGSPKAVWPGRTGSIDRLSARAIPESTGNWLSPAFAKNICAEQNAIDRQRIPTRRWAIDYVATTLIRWGYLPGKAPWTWACCVSE